MSLIEVFDTIFPISLLVKYAFFQIKSRLLNYPGEGLKQSNDTAVGVTDSSKIYT